MGQFLTKHFIIAQPIIIPLTLHASLSSGHSDKGAHPIQFLHLIMEVSISVDTTFYFTITAAF
jgi:hypothetical protein